MKLHNEEKNDLYSSPNITPAIKWSKHIIVREQVGTAC
jgi:hypothetical protein